MALTPAQQKELIALLKEQAAQQQQINSGIDGYLEALKKAKAIQETINTNREIEAKILAKARTLSGQERVDELEKLRILRKTTSELVTQGKIIRQQLKDADKLKMTFASMGAGIVKNFGALPKLVEKSFGRIKQFGLFEMDKAIKQSALDMGMLGKQSSSYQKTIRNSSLSTNELGMGVKELSKMQALYSDELGRTVELGDAGLKAMSAMAAATGLGLEGAAKLSAEMDNQGLSAERTKDFVEQTMNDSSKMGLNTAKVIKNIQNNMKMLNKYNFKGGVKGLAKMAQTTAKLGVDMNVVSGMAEKLFDVEGAVEMSSQLQVMGGKWAQLADPFKLMYMARNDMEGLTKMIGEAAEQSAHFNKETGEFEISGLEMHRLRKIAEQTGVSYEELATAGKNAAKFSKIKTQVSFDMNDEAEEFLTNTAKLDKNGKAFIEIGGEKKFLNQLGASGKELIRRQVLETATLEKRAKSAQTFDEQLTNLVNMMKTTMLPVVDGLKNVLGPLVEKLFADDNFKNQLKDLGEDIGTMVATGAKFVKGIAEFAVWLGPKGVLGTLLAGKAFMFLADKWQWIQNGIALAKGFNMGSEDGGIMDKIGGKMGQKKGAGFKTNFKGGLGSKMLKFGGIAAGLLETGMEFMDNKEKGMDTTENAVRSGSKGVGAGLGAWGGAAAGAALGSVVPIVGTAIGALIGGALGAWGGSEAGEGLGNAIYGPKAHDAEFSNGNMIIQPNKVGPGKPLITKFHDKDNVKLSKKGGAYDQIDTKQRNSKISVEPIQINGTINLVSPGGVVIEDILKNPITRAAIAKMVTSEIGNARNGGKPKG